MRIDRRPWMDCNGDSRNRSSSGGRTKSAARPPGPAASRPRTIATGTPSGVGMGRTPQEWLKPGDMMETEVEGIGVLRNRVVAV